MPVNEDLSEEEERDLEDRGGVSLQTKKDRECVYEDFRKFAEEKGKKTISEQIDGDCESFPRFSLTTSSLCELSLWYCIILTLSIFNAICTGEA